MSMSNDQEDLEYAVMERSHRGPDNFCPHGIKYYEKLEKMKKLAENHVPKEYESSDNTFDFEGMERSVTDGPDAGPSVTEPSIFTGFRVSNMDINGNTIYCISGNGVFITIDGTNFCNVNENTEFSLWKKETENGYKLTPLSSPNLNFKYMCATWSLKKGFQIIVNY